MFQYSTSNLTFKLFILIIHILSNFSLLTNYVFDFFRLVIEMNLWYQVYSYRSSYPAILTFASWEHVFWDLVLDVKICLWFPMTITITALLTSVCFTVRVSFLSVWWNRIHNVNYNFTLITQRVWNYYSNKTMN